MNDIIYRQVEHAIESGKMIQAIKLLRQVENLNLTEAKERVESMREDMRKKQLDSPYLKAKQQAEEYQSNATRAHSHQPARSNTYNVESELPTETFLYFQRGEVNRGLQVLQEIKGVNKTTAKRMAKMFFQEHPEYSSGEIISLMGSGSIQSDDALSNTARDHSVSKKKNHSKKKSKIGVFEFIFIVFILFNVIKAITS